MAIGKTDQSEVKVHWHEPPLGIGRIKRNEVILMLPLTVLNDSHRC